MPGRLPHLASQDDRGVDADHVVALAHHRLPPLSLDVLFQLDAERAVVPRRTLAAVDLRTRKDKSPALTQGNDRIDQIGGHPARLSGAIDGSGIGGKVSGRRTLTIRIDGEQHLERRRLVDRLR